MPKLSLQNVSKGSSTAMVFVTTILAAVAANAPTILDSLPGTVSKDVTDWINWSLKQLVWISGLITLFTKGKN